MGLEMLAWSVGLSASGQFDREEVWFCTLDSDRAEVGVLLNSILTSRPSVRRKYRR
jgi:hypothetical protein